MRNEYAQKFHNPSNQAEFFISTKKHAFKTKLMSEKSCSNKQKGINIINAYVRFCYSVMKVYIKKEKVICMLLYFLK